MTSDLVVTMALGPEGVAARRFAKERREVNDRALAWAIHVAAGFLVVASITGAAW